MFARSPKLREFLLYICENTLADRLERVREQQIGCEVFGRRPDYNMSGDSIVRVEARELRRRLELYFNTDGRDEPTVIVLPKGAYVPSFVPRETVVGNGKCAQDRPLPRPAIISLKRPIRWRAFVVGALAVLLLLESAVLLIVLSRGTAVERDPVASSSSAYRFYIDLLGPMAADRRAETLIVLSNPRVLVFFGSNSAEVAGIPSGRIVPVPPQLAKPLAPAANRGFESLPYHFLRLTEDSYTGMGEAIAAFRVGRMMEAIGRPVRLTQGRFLNWDSARKQHLVVLGSPNLSDWTNRNVLTGNFSFTAQGVHNASPRAGEPANYAAVRDAVTGQILEDYGLVWMSTSSSGSRLLVLAGCTSGGTGGAAEYFADPQKMRASYEKIRLSTRRGEVPANWQVLLRVKVRDGIAVDATHVTHRIVEGTH
jgi:hypothetical protein